MVDTILSQRAVSKLGLSLTGEIHSAKTNDTTEPPQNHPPGFPLAIAASITPDFSGSGGGESSEICYANSLSQADW